MTYWKMLTRGIQALGLGAALLFGLAALPALGEDNAWDCLAKGDPNGAGSARIHIMNFGIDKGEDDAGSEFEFDFRVNIVVHHYDPGKPDWTGPVACRIDGDWSQDLPIWDMFTGQYRVYQLNRGFVIANLPRDARIRFWFGAQEQDDFIDDMADIDPASNTLPGIQITIFAEQNIAQTMVGERSGVYDVKFGQIHRMQGNGSSTWTGDEFRAQLDYVVDLNMDPVISPEVMGIIQAMPQVQMITGMIDIEGMCHSYADRAVELNNEAMSYGCGYQWPVWSSDWNHHYSWCVNGNNWQQSGEGNVQRAADLQQCAAQKGQPNAANPLACAIYAAEATASATQAQALGCGYTDWRWSTDYNGHFTWCMSGAAPSAMLGETIARASMLAACSASKGGP